MTINILYLSLFIIIIVVAYALRYRRLENMARQFNMIGRISHNPCFLRHSICSPGNGLEELSAKLKSMNYAVILNTTTSSLLILPKWYSLVPVYLVFRKVNAATEVEYGDMSFQQYMPSILADIYLDKIMKIISLLELKVEKSEANAN